MNQYTVNMNQYMVNLSCPCLTLPPPLSLPASQSLSLPTFQPPSLSASQSLSLQASQSLSLPASQFLSLPASQPLRVPASQPPSLDATSTAAASAPYWIPAGQHGLGGSDLQPVVVLPLRRAAASGRRVSVSASPRASSRPSRVLRVRHDVPEPEQLGPGAAADRGVA